MGATHEILASRANPASGLTAHANYHEFCKLLGRLKTNYQLSELVRERRGAGAGGAWGGGWEGRGWEGRVWGLGRWVRGLGLGAWGLRPWGLGVSFIIY